MPDEKSDADAAEQQDHFHEVENELGVVCPDIPALQRAQVGDAVDAAGVTLLTDDQDGQDRGDRLGDNGEIRTADPPLEHRSADNEGEDRRNRDDCEDRESQAVERLPEERELRELIPVHEVRDAGRRLDLGVGDAGCFQLEKHRHAVAAEAEEHSLPEAQNATISPTDNEADRNKRVGQIFRDQVEPEDIQGQRQDNNQQNCKRQNADKFGAVREARVVVDGFGDNSLLGAFLYAFLGHFPGLFTSGP